VEKELEGLKMKHEKLLKDGSSDAGEKDTRIKALSQEVD